MLVNQMRWIKKINQFFHVRQRFWSVVGTFLLFFLFQYYKRVNTFPYDAGDYWDLSVAKYFLNFPTETIRGYFFPLLLTPARVLTDLIHVPTQHVYRFYSSAIYACAFALLLPEFYRSVFGGKISFSRRLITPILVLIFLPGVILYPLSDLPCFLLAILCLSLVRNLEIKQKLTLPNIAQVILIGVVAYGVYNTRTIYVYLLMTLFIALPLMTRKLGHKIIVVLCLLVGVGLAAAPQMMINHKNTGRFTPWVMTQINNKSLFAKQLLWGITMQRYSTFMHNPVQGGGLYAIDPGGVKIFDQEKLTADDLQIARYFKLVRNYPYFFLGAYTRHAINGLDLRDGEVYVLGLEQNRNFRSVANFSVLFLMLLILFIRTRPETHLPVNSGNDSAVFGSGRSKVISNWWVYLLLIGVPVAAIIPGAIETRFFLPVHVMTYLTIALNGDWRETTQFIRQKLIGVVLFFFVSLCALLAVSQNTIALESPVFDIKYKL